MANDVTSKVLLGLDAKEFRRGIQQVDAKLKETTKLFNNLGQVIGASFAVAAIQQFASESIALARQAEGVRAAFYNLNKPQVLDNLRAAVKGTVSDLELMKSANQAAAIRIEMNDLAKVMQYVSKYARATGQDMNQLMSDATLELVRQTGLRLDQLGISLVDVRERMKQTGDFTAAVLQEMAENSDKLGDAGETAAEKLDRLTAAIENQKTALGTRLLPVYSWFLGQLEEILNIGPKITDAMADITGAIARVPVAALGGLDQAAGGGMQGEQNFLMGRQNALAAALAAGNGPKAYNSSGPKKLEETLALLRGQLQDYNAQLEQAEVGSKAFSSAKVKVDELTDRIKKLTAPAKEVFSPPTIEKITLAKKEMGDFGTVSLRAGEVLRSSTIPSMQDTGQAANAIVTSLERYNAEMALLNQVGAEFGYIFVSSFNAAMVNGTTFFEEIKNALKAYIQQMLVAVGVTAALAAIMSALVPNMTFGKAFKGLAGSTGLGSIFGEGGIIELVGTLKGFDLQMTSNRTNNFLRSGN